MAGGFSCSHTQQDRFSTQQLESHLHFDHKQVSKHGFKLFLTVST